MMKMLNTLTATERTQEKALGLTRNGGQAQSLTDRTDTVYCETHGLVKSFHGHCEECVDEGYRDWDATRIAKTLIPSWTGIEVGNRTVIVAPVSDALEAVQTISRYKHDCDAIVLIKWDRLITVLDHGRIGPSWVLNEAADADAAEEIECARCCQPFKPTWGDERVCDACYRIENGARW